MTSTASNSVENRLLALEAELENRLSALDAENQKLRTEIATLKDASGSTSLSKDEYKRYGRQMIVPSVGITGQLHLKGSSVLIVGAGGLGCPAAAYLAGAGVGTLGICDGDVVETSNLHRQIAHATSRVGQTKTESMIEYLRDINPNVTYRSHTHHLTPATAARTLTQYDLVLDCTDHPAVRYLISDTCVLLGKPLVSASALRTEGQLLVLNNPPGKGACYRCIWPKPPPPESVLSCGEGGILGPVVGVMGVLMATEAIKLLTSQKGNIQKEEIEANSEGNKVQEITDMLLYSAYSNPTFRNLKLRGKKEGCIACDLERRQISLEKLDDGRLDYVAFCGTRNEDRITDEEKVDVRDYAELRKEGKEHILIDVRPEVEWGICKLDGSINVPLTQFLQSLPLPNSIKGLSGAPLDQHWLPQDRNIPIYIVCKQGNDSQVAVKRLKSYLASRRCYDREHEETGMGRDESWVGGIWDVKGGLVKWACDVDTTFPEY